jgi:Holliday junction resolvase RusA-like endonuclease
VKLRRNSATHQHNYRAALVREYQEQVWIAGQRINLIIDDGAYITEGIVTAPPIVPWERAEVRYTWYSTHETDVDNIIASMKPALDVIKSTGPRPLGIIRDDGPGVTVTAEWKRERVRDKQRVEIEVRRVQDSMVRADCHCPSINPMESLLAQPHVEGCPWR